MASSGPLPAYRANTEYEQALEAAITEMSRQIDAATLAYGRHGVPLGATDRIERQRRWVAGRLLEYRTVKQPFIMAVSDGE